MEYNTNVLHKCNAEDLQKLIDIVAVEYLCARGKQDDESKIIMQKLRGLNAKAKAENAVNDIANLQVELSSITGKKNEVTPEAVQEAADHILWGFQNVRYVLKDEPDAVVFDPKLTNTITHEFVFGKGAILPTVSRHAQGIIQQDIDKEEARIALEIANRPENVAAQEKAEQEERESIQKRREEWQAKDNKLSRFNMIGVDGKIASPAVIIPSKKLTAFSDMHGAYDNLLRLFQKMRNTKDHFASLGDVQTKKMYNEVDPELLERLSAIEGNCDMDSRDSGKFYIPGEQLITVGDKKIYLAHGDKYPHSIDEKQWERMKAAGADPYKYTHYRYASRANELGGADLALGGHFHRFDDGGVIDGVRCVTVPSLTQGEYLRIGLGKKRIDVELRNI